MRLSILLTALIAMPSLGASYMKASECGTSVGIPAAYADGAPSEVLSDIPSVHDHIYSGNLSDATLCYCWGVNSAADCVDNICLPANGSFAFDEITVAPKAFVRYEGAAPTAGPLCVGSW